MNQLLFNKIKEKFFATLDTKIWWGIEDIKKAYLEASASAMLEWIDYTGELLPPVTSPEDDLPFQP